MDAVLEISSVNNKLIEHINIVIQTGGRYSNIFKLSPNTTDRPDRSQPLAIAKPPPSNKMTDQDIFSCVVFQSNSIGEVFKFFGSAGIKKNNRTTNIVGMESLIYLDIFIDYSIQLLRFKSYCALSTNIVVHPFIKSGARNSHNVSSIVNKRKTANS